MEGNNEESDRQPAANETQGDSESSRQISDVVIVSDEGEDSDSECEIISDFDPEEMKWLNFGRMRSLIARGYTDPQLLLTRVFGCNPGFLPSDTDSMWGLLATLLSDAPKRKRLTQYSSTDAVLKLLKEKNNILVLTGAGISVSCGIPDFRSHDGVYARLARDFPDLRSPQDMFDLHYFQTNPNPFFTFAKELFPGQFKPSFTHRFIKLLERKSKLLRNYTQNIDTLEQAAGISKVIQCHGSFATASCLTCNHKVPGDAIREAIMSQRIPYCPHCRPEIGLAGIPAVTGAHSPPPPVGPGESSATVATSPVYGILKPDIVFFGEGLPTEFHSSLQEDMNNVDLVLVMGSSLKVRPVSHIPSSVPASVPQILINRESLPSHRFDAELLGDCDCILEYLCSCLGWDVDLEDSDSTPTENQGLLTKVDLSVPLRAAVAALSTEAEGTIGTTNGPSGDCNQEAAREKAPEFAEVVEVQEVSPKNLPTPRNGDEESSIPPHSEPVEVSAEKTNMEDGTSEHPIEIDEMESDSFSDSDDNDTDEEVFNPANYLPDKTYTCLPGRKYVFRGAQVSTSLVDAVNYLQMHSQQQANGDSSSETESLSSQSSQNSNVSMEGDSFMRRVLRKCSRDPELQRHRLTALRLNGSASVVPTAAGASSGVANGADVLINCDSSSTSSSSSSQGHVRSTPEKKRLSDHDSDSSVVIESASNGNPSMSKRRRCVPEEEVNDALRGVTGPEKPVDA